MGLSFYDVGGTSVDPTDIVKIAKELFGLQGAVIVVLVCGAAFLGVYGNRNFLARTASNNRLACALENMGESIKDRNTLCDGHRRVQEEMVGSMKQMMGIFQAHTESTHKAYVDQVHELVDAVIKSRQGP